MLIFVSTLCMTCMLVILFHGNVVYDVDDVDVDHCEYDVDGVYGVYVVCDVYEVYFVRAVYMV